MEHVGEIIRRLIETDPRFVRLREIAGRLDSTPRLAQLRCEMEAAMLAATTPAELATALELAEAFGREARAAE